ncbi:5580_t:CDS:2 [Entrophospora sp. SA101]|nr:5580_t:CDS:2 [Entrophospora sp. SA101]
MVLKVFTERILPMNLISASIVSRKNMVQNDNSKSKLHKLAFISIQNNRS